MRRTAEIPAQLSAQRSLRRS
ncbi:MAG: hypothetical protein RLZZ481_1913, partial [Pseudomonadota bacterium]